MTLYASKNNDWQFWLGDGTAWKAITGSVVNMNTWTHLAGNTLAFYINGELQGTSTLSQVKNTDNGLFISSQANTGANFPGQLDDVRIWATALSQTEINANMNLHLSGAENNLLAYYSFE